MDRSATVKSNTAIECSVILPCRNEEASLGQCLEQIMSVFDQAGIVGEIIVSDSSNDRSPAIAQAVGAVLVKHDRAGYGVAYQEGFTRAQGTYVFCADPDGTYDFSEIPRFVHELQQGADMIVGNRFAGSMHAAAMPWHHRYIGNPVLSWLFRCLFQTKLHDIHCGMRAIRKEALDRLSFRTPGMEFASEMIVQALRHNLVVRELPIAYHPRMGESKLRSFSDGWRHLRFMLLYSPNYLFLWPGIVLACIGLIGMGWLYVDDPHVGGVQLFFHPMFVTSFLIILGYQLILFALFAKTYAMIHLHDTNAWLQKLYRYATLERGVVLALIMAFVGLWLFVDIVLHWVNSGFGALQEVENALIGLTILLIGVQTLFSSFMLSILSIHAPRP